MYCHVITFKTYSYLQFIHRLTFTPPDHWTTLGNSVRVSLRKLFRSICAANIRRPGISNWVPNHTWVKWSLGYLFLVPRKDHVRPV